MLIRLASYIYFQVGDHRYKIRGCNKNCQVTLRYLDNYYIKSKKAINKFIFIRFAENTKSCFNDKSVYFAKNMHTISYLPLVCTEAILRITGRMFRHNSQYCFGLMPGWAFHSIVDEDLILNALQWLGNTVIPNESNS